MGDLVVNGESHRQWVVWGSLMLDPWIPQQRWALATAPQPPQTAGDVPKEVVSCALGCGVFPELLGTIGPQYDAYDS